MRFMNLSLLAPALMLAIVATPAPSRADDLEIYKQFLAQTNGRWSGQGGSRDYTNGKQDSFNVDVDMYDRGNNDWVQTVSSQSQNGGGHNDFNSFRITGKMLLVDMQEVFGGVAFVEFATPNRIDYRVQAMSDNGGWLDYNYSFRVSGNEMAIQLRKENNGQTIFESAWSAKKSQ